MLHRFYPLPTASLLALGLFLSMIVAHAEPPAFDFQTLDAPAATGTYANGISDGNIVGYSRDDNYIAHAFLYSIAGKSFTTLNDRAAGHYSNMGSFANGISGGNIVGYREIDEEDEQGYLYNLATRRFTIVNFPTGVQGNYTTAIADGNIVGYYRENNYNAHAFIFNMSARTYTQFDDTVAVKSPPSPGFTGTFACGISGGNIVGYYEDGCASYYGFIYNGSVFTPLNDPLAGTGSNMGTVPTGISGNTVVGHYHDTAGSHGFLYDLATKTFTTIDDPAGAPGTTQIMGISGDSLVGFYDDAAGKTHGFLATRKKEPAKDAAPK